MSHPQGPRGETQEWPNDGQNDEGQIFDDVYDAPVQRIFHEVNEEGIGDVVHPDRPQEPPPPGTERLLQISDREERQKVGKYESNPEEEEHRDRRRGADPTEPPD